MKSLTLKNNTFLIFLLFSALKIVLTINSGIHTDEGYYWDWTRFLSLGYFDHPPMVAWMIRAMQPFFGMGPAAIKMAAALCSIGALGALFLIVRRFSTGTRPLLILGAVWFGTPVFGIISTIMSPDLPLFLFWSISLYLGYILVDTEKPTLKTWLFLGISTGLGMYGKYTFILFFPAFALTLLISRRDLLKSSGPYIALITAGVIGIPHLMWNSANNWPSMTFQLNHGLGSESTYSLKYLGEYLSAQFALFNPFLSIALIIAVVKILKEYRKNPALIFLTITTVFPLLFFAWTNLKKRGNANWPAMAFLSGALLIVWLYEHGAGIKMKKYLRSSLIFGLICLSIISVQMIHPVLPVQTVVNELFGWDTFSDDVNSQIKSSNYKDLPIMANRYQMAGMLGLMMDEHPRVYALNLYSRTNHYAYLPERIERASGTFIFVQELDNEGKLPEYLRIQFTKTEMFGTAPLIQGKKTRHYGLFAVQLKNPKEL